MAITISTLLPRDRALVVHRPRLRVMIWPVAMPQKCLDELSIEEIRATIGIGEANTRSITHTGTARKLGNATSSMVHSREIPCGRKAIFPRLVCSC